MINRFKAVEKRSGSWHRHFPVHRCGGCDEHEPQVVLAQDQRAAHRQAVNSGSCLGGDASRLLRGEDLESLRRSAARLRRVRPRFLPVRPVDRPLDARELGRLPRLPRALVRRYTQIRPLPSSTARYVDVFQAATFYAWLNHGCTLADEAARDEFLKWVPFTAELVRRLCSA